MRNQYSRKKSAMRSIADAARHGGQSACYEDCQGRYKIISEKNATTARSHTGSTPASERIAIDLGVVSGTNQSHGPRGPRAQKQTDPARSVRQSNDRTSFTLAPVATEPHPQKLFCFWAGTGAPNLKNGLQ
jgi:hypothetical protein